MSVIDTSDTSRKLDEWVRWTRMGSVPRTGYPASSSYANKKKGMNILSITEEEAMKIDAAIARLRQKDRETGEFLKRYYFEGCNLTRSAERVGIKRERARMLLAHGESFIAGKLD